jgi:hypothetical protein
MAKLAISLTTCPSCEKKHDVMEDFCPHCGFSIEDGYSMSDDEDIDEILYSIDNELEDDYSPLSEFEIGREDWPQQEINEDL